MLVFVWVYCEGIENGNDIEEQMRDGRLCNSSLNEQLLPVNSASNEFHLAAYTKMANITVNNTGSSVHRGCNVQLQLYSNFSTENLSVPSSVHNCDSHALLLIVCYQAGRGEVLLVISYTLKKL